jgi:hypothetical protein
MFRMHTSIGHKNIIEKYNNNSDVFVIHPSPFINMGTPLKTRVNSDAPE